MPLRFRARLLSSFLFACVALLSSARGASDWLPIVPDRLVAPLRGVSERGAPAYSYQGFEQVGLTSIPSDLIALADGRMLLFTPRQIAIGDGVRWEVLESQESPNRRLSNRVVADADGGVYVGLSGGIGQIEFTNGGTWRVREVVHIDLGNTSSAQPVFQPIIARGAWLWHCAAGPLFRWRPGEKLERVGTAEDVDQIAQLGAETVYRKWGDTGLFYSRNGQSVREPLGGNAETTADVASIVETPEGRALAVTNSGRWYRFDGVRWSPIARTQKSDTSNVMSTFSHVGDGYTAISVDGRGLSFLDPEGREVQMLDRKIDSRITRINRIVSGRGGIVWVLLHDGVARIEFPCPSTSFEALIPSGLVTGEPYRFEGRLWVLANGHLHRGEYDGNGNLSGFVEDGPDESPVFTVSVIEGEAYLGSLKGFWVRRDRKWTLAVPGPVNGRVIGSTDAGRRLAYAAKNELGYLVRKEDGSWSRESVVDVNCGDVWAAVADKPGIFWLEVGLGRPARADFTGALPTLKVFSDKDGVPLGWAQVFSIDGQVHFLVSSKALVFSEDQQRFVPDPDVSADKPWLEFATGRPMRDALGRIWVTREGTTVVLESKPGMPQREIFRFPPGVQAYSFRAEPSGVVWLIQRRRLIRFDPSVPLPPQEPVRALVTQVEFSNDRRTLYGPIRRIDPIPYKANSFTIHFQAPGNPFASPASFQFRLEGGENKWVSAGVSGAAVLSQLPEGRYVLHVRPVIAGVAGLETELPFSVLPPWYRHPIAYAVYALSFIGIVSLVGLYTTYSQRREKAELERQVAERTRAVQEANEHLARQVAETSAKSRALQASEERYRTLYDNNPAMFLTLDVTGRILSINQYGAEQLGYSVNELIGSRLLTLVQAEDRVDVERSLRESAGAPGKLVALQVRAVRRTGQAIFIKQVIRAVPQITQGLVLFVVCEDVTAQVQLEAQLRQAQKMEAVGQLAGGVAHDFNNLLTIIQGQAEWAETHATSNEERDECIREIRRAAEQAGKLTRQLLVFSRQQAMHITPTDLNELVSKVVKLMQRVLGEDIRVEIHLLPGSAAVRVDSGMIEQVVLNLGLNARDAMPGGGCIEIRVETLAAGAERVAGRAGCRPGLYHCIRFKDTGCGMPESVINRIFEPFFTTKAPGQGTGLGLATSSSIVSQHHGWIEVQSEVGKGTTFLVCLPAEDPRTSTAGEASVQAISSPIGSQRVLLVEDEPAVRRVAQRMLERSGYSVIEAENADAALEAWERVGGEIDILLTDLLMPGSMNGRALAELLAKRSPRLRVCLMSGHDPEVLARKSGQPGPMRPHLIKPFTRDSLIAAVSRSTPTGLG